MILIQENKKPKLKLNSCMNRNIKTCIKLNKNTIKKYKIWKNYMTKKSRILKKIIHLKHQKRQKIKLKKQTI